jgi:hypothetical protein
MDCATDGLLFDSYAKHFPALVLACVIIEGRPKKFVFIPTHRGRVLGSKMVVKEVFIRFRDSLYQSLGFDD